MTNESFLPVRTRRVHYISGFDPRGPRFYHRLYREEAVKQARHSGAIFDIGSRKNRGRNTSGWNVTASWGGQKVETDYQFMGWDDLVRNHWENLFQLFARSLPVYVKYVLVGGFNRVAKASRNAFYTSVYPMYYLIGLGLMLFLGSFLVGWVTAILTESWLAALGLAGCIFAYFGRKFWLRADRLGVLWLLRTCIFVVKWGSRPFPDIDGRIHEMADHILKEQEQKPVDEVLIIGHSIGTMFALRVVARILEKQSSKTALKEMQFVTLGQCIPYLGVMPGASAFRHDLGILARDPRIFWTDFTAPPDPLCFYKVNPLAVSAVTPASQDWPRQLGVRIFRMFSPKTYQGMRRDKLRLHFQYLMASELAADYDYFFITAGPCNLRTHPEIG